MRMNKHAKILDLVVLVVVVLFVWMNPFDIHLIKVVSAFRPKKPPANLPPGFFGTKILQICSTHFGATPPLELEW